MYALNLPRCSKQAAWTVAMIGSLLGFFANTTEAQPAPGNASNLSAGSLRPGEATTRITSPSSQLSIVELHSRVIEFAGKIRLVDDFNPDILSVTALTPKQLRLRGETPGVTSLRVTDEYDQVFRIEIFVETDVRELQSHINRLFPGSAVQVIGVRENIILQGWVSRPDQIPQIVDLARTFGAEVQNHLRVGGGDLIQLSVRVLEVQRSKLEQFGFNFLALGQNAFLASTPGGLAPVATATLPFGGPPAIGIQQASLANQTIQFAILGSDFIFEGFIEALKQESLLKILANPTVATTSGRPATIHSGGEFPILVPQGIGTATIQFRSFGVSMETVPIILGNGRVQLDIAAEVSDRDFSNSVDVNGIRVPGIINRDVNTQVKMNFGETLMIGGLISSRVTTSTNKVPYLGDIPVLGAAFSRKNQQLAETELVILVTPHLVSPMRPGEVPCGGPGLNSDSLTTHELLWDQHVEVPNFGFECEVGPNGAPCQSMPRALPAASVPPEPPGMISPDSKSYMPPADLGPQMPSPMSEEEPQEITPTSARGGQATGRAVVPLGYPRPLRRTTSLHRTRKAVQNPPPPTGLISPPSQSR